jgi:FAD:protein FMN transferase
MGSDAHVVVVGGPADLIQTARARIGELEHRWSRFLAHSEVSELNRCAGRGVRVSDDTVELVTRAAEAWRLTGGSFDPTVLGSMIRAGYDRSFDELGPASAAGLSVLGLGAADIRIDGDVVELPAGTGFDPGGIGKGLAADLVVADLRRRGAEGACVNLGGDVRVAGRSPDGDGWTVAIEHPWSPEPIATVGVTEGAVATSTTLKRRWRSDGVDRHHVIDPATGMPSDTDLTLVTVIAAQAWVAEVLAKAVLLRGSAHPFDIIGGTGAQALAVDNDGRVAATPGFASFTGGVEPRPLKVHGAEPRW